MCGMESNALSVYINPSRGQVIVNEANYIDTDDPVNDMFLKKRIAKGKAQPMTLSSPAFIPKSSFKGLEDIPSYEESEQRTKYFDSLKREKEVEKLKIEIEKKRGEVIPSELIKPVFTQHNTSLLTTFKNATDHILIEFAKIKDMNPQEIAQMRGIMTGAINEGIMAANASTEKQLENIISEYSEKRGVGERL